MNPHQDLLDDLLPPPGESSSAQLLKLLRREKSRVRRVQAVTASLVGLLIAGGLASLFFHDQPAESVVTAPKPASPLLVERITDEQLVQLLGDQPVALVKWPHQDREYLVLWKH